MFPPSLQKNIRELDRQISLLETECENMESEKRDNSGKTNSKTLTRDTPSKLFIPNSYPSPAAHSVKMLNLPPVASRMHSTSSAHGKPRNNDSKCLGDLQKRSEKKENSNGGNSTQEGCSEYEASLNEKDPTDSFEAKKPRKESNESLKLTESSGDGYPIRVEVNKQKNVSTEASKHQQIWCDLAKEKPSADKCQSRRINKNAADDRESFFGRNPAEAKFSSDEERSRRIWFATGETNSLNEKRAGVLERFMPSQSKLPTKRRPRSARTRKKSDEVPLDVNMSKALHDKETQCILKREEREKTEFMQNLNASIRSLQLLMDELKTKPTRERRNEVLDDIQNVLKKLNGIKSMNALQDTLGTFSSPRGTDVRLMEGEGNFTDQKKAFSTLKKFCQELSEEKSTLVEEINTKNRKITSLRNKEKEYLSLISNLKFNLEGLKEEAEDGKLAKRDLLLLKAKLREEAKVIEVLKRSHGKMQALVEHYVLENDKLRAEVKMAKLESQKYHVLLAGKEVEITKYQQEIELFQRQINQQLCLLRSKPTESEVQHAMEVISAQANILQTEVDSLPSETTLDKGEQSITLELTETTSSMRTQAERGNVGPAGRLPADSNKKLEEEADSMKLSSSNPELRDADANVKDGGFTSCKSDDSLGEGRVCDRYNLGLRGVLSSSKNLRGSVNEILQDMRRGSSEKFWPSLSNSSTTSQCSVAST